MKRNVCYDNDGMFVLSMRILHFIILSSTMQKWILSSLLVFLLTSIASSYSLYEGDLIVTGKSYSLSNKSRKRRHTKQQKEYLWLEKVVPYEISSELHAYSAVILSAFEELQNKTCISFVRRKHWHPNYVTFRDGDVCASSVGRIFWKTGAQFVTLARHCLNKVTIMHELMHTLGFLHEHNRNDRDKYIEILWENIIEEEKYNFHPANIFLSATVDMEYDFNSILHYDNMAYSSNGKPTIRSLSNPGLLLGNKKGLSTNDVIRINKHYGCGKDQHIWRSWSSWSLCDMDCVTYRQRVCLGEALCGAVSKCDVQTQMRYCSTKECSSAFGVWSKWTKCHMGQQTRFRLCNKPNFGRRNCKGRSYEFQSCKSDDELFNHPCSYYTVGLENNEVPNHYLTSSYSLNNQTLPQFARLNNQNSWCGAIDMLKKGNQFLQIKLLHSTKITRIAIQGHPYLNWWISSFRLLYKNHKNWMFYKENGDEPKIFKVAKETSTSIFNLLDGVDARYIAINPLNWHGLSPCIRLELYGCE